jgi:hypothetical protein
MAADQINEVTHLVTNPSALAALIAVSYGLVKLLEMTITALVKKYTKGDKQQSIDVSFDPEITNRITKISDKVEQMHSVMSKSDNDGTPMVYSSRSGMEAVRDIAVIIRNVSMTQERLAHVMERLEQKFTEHDRMDHTVQSNINISLERLMKAFDDHDKRVSEGLILQNDILRIAQANQEVIIRYLKKE